MLVSIITPAYNSERYIADAINSVISQTYDNWELVIVNDGSSDNTKEIIEKYTTRDSRIRSINTPNNGVTKSRLIALQESRGEWIAFLDADDCWMPTKLERCISFLNSEKADLIISSGHYFDQEEGIWQVPGINFEKSILTSLLKKNFIPLLSVVMKKEIIKKVNGFSLDRGFDAVEDYDLWIRISLGRYKIVSLEKEFLFKYRIHDQQATSTKRRINTCKKVGELFIFHWKNGLLTEKQAMSAIYSHYRELIDYYLNQKDRLNSELAIQNLACQTNMKIRKVLLLFLIKFNLSITQITSWRILKS